MYSLFRPFLFTLPPEFAHKLAIWALRGRLIPRAKTNAHPSLSQILWGKTWSHPLGLAAGFDKNAQAILPLLNQGFSFVEAGTVTPLPQKGNTKPRVFRLKEDEAVINRYGFNSKGMDYAKARLEVINAQRHSSSSSSSVSDGIIGINIGKNKTQTDAVADYLAGYRMLAPFADYVTINISSPNTPNLRELQHKEGLRPLLETIAHEKETLCPNTPLWLKIAPDVTETQLQAIIELSLEYNIDALVIGNTTIEGKQMLKDRARNEEGGLSGKPLRDHSTQILRRAYVISEGKIPLIGVGGIASAADAYEKICAGATLVQLYTALIYHGFSLVDQIVNELPLLLEKDGFSCIGDAIGCNAKKNN